MDLAERISTLRGVNGLSARQLAALVDVAPTTITRIESGAGEAWPVLHVEDVARAAESAALVRKQPSSFGMRITLIQFDGVSEIGRVDIDEVTVVARDQVVIDAYGGIDRMVEQADILMGKRVE